MQNQNTALQGSGARQGTRMGILAGLAAYFIWGIAPLYFKAVSEVPLWEVLAQRVFWSLVVCLVLLAILRRWSELKAAIVNPKTRRALALSTALITVNWSIYIWAVAEGRVLESSLGYYINPLLNVALGVLVLKEKLSRFQAIAVGLAGLGVLNQAVALGHLPWVALSLGISFALYGLVRKRAPVESLVGLTVETGIVAPLALGYMVWLGATGHSSYGDAWTTDLLLVGLGPLTAIPLLMFALAARRLKLTTLGFLQYMAPTLQFILALTVWREAFTWVQGITFGLIWTALLFYSLDALRPKG